MRTMGVICVCLLATINVGYGQSGKGGGLGRPQARNGGGNGADEGKGTATISKSNVSGYGGGYGASSLGGGYGAGYGGGGYASSGYGGSGLSAVKSRKIDLKFPGGTLEELTMVLKKVYPELNLLISVDASQAKVPELELRHVGYNTVLNLVGNLTEPPVQINFMETDDFVATVNPRSGVSHQQLPASQQQKRQPPNTPEIEVFVVGPMFTEGSGVKIEDLLSMIESVVELTGSTENAKPPQIKYHSSTGLLVVAGTSRDIEMVDKVIQGMNQSAAAMVVEDQFQGIRRQVFQVEQQLVEQIKSSRDQSNKIRQLETQIEKLKIEAQFEKMREKADQEKEDEASTTPDSAPKTFRKE